MKAKKLNFIRGLKDRLRPGLPLGMRLAVLALAVLLFATPALAAGQGEVPQEVLGNKPEITIQGNLVVDNGKPTGFYELALCVKSPRRIEGPHPDDYTTTAVLSESDYARALKLIKQVEDGERPASDFPVSKDDYNIQYYPFTAASAVVGVNADILTAVGWNVTDVTYAAWDSDNNEYKANNTDYPWGIDVSANTPAEWDDLDADPFPKVDKAKATGLRPTVIALDAAGDSANTFTVAAQVVDYHEDGSNNTNTAFITMSANAHGNKPVVFKESTPVVVIRFSYDLKRFPKTAVNKEYNEARDLITGKLIHTTDQITGDSTGEDQTGFWIGLDRGTGQSLSDGKTPLTWLADSKLDGGSNFKKFEEKIAQTEVDQSVWTRLSTKATAGGIASGDWDETSYYYYLGAEGNTKKEPRAAGSSILVDIGGVPTTVDHVSIPDTICPRKVLTLGETENPAVDTTIDADWTDKAGYTYFENLLHLSDETLRIKMVNEPTYKKPTGGKGGNQILFYDWDDTLIGALIVDKGDVRADVNRYIEENLVHPDLRVGELLATNLGGNMPDFSDPTSLSADAKEYGERISSLDREYTYRGSYNSKTDGSGVAYPENSTEAGYDVDKVGSDYPLTNKLDYVFYKHLNTVTSAEWEDTTTNKKWTENYFTLNDLTVDPVAAQYPWAYGWAIVEDAANTKMKNKTGWPVQVDSVKLSSTWTTFQSGELRDQDPEAGNVAIPTTAAGMTITLDTPVYPGGLDTDWSAAGSMYKDPSDYTYMTSSADANGYLRFADFSDTNTLFKNGQDVLIVKAVYEPSSDIYLLGNYTVVRESLKVVRYSTTASTENGIYSFAFQYQRANDDYGYWAGVRRIREPAVKTGFVFDAKSIDETVDLSQQGLFYIKNVADNGEVMDVDLTTSGDLWKMEYTLVDIYGGNVGTGANRSSISAWGSDIKDNFIYDPDDPKYDERQGTDGFVVQATINNLLEEATKAARGEKNTLSVSCGLATIKDLNFKRAAGDPPTEYTNGTVYRVGNYIADLVSRLYKDGVSIDPKTGNVTLTWHQIQKHILMSETGDAFGIYTGSGNGSGSISDLMTDGECAGFIWCRMDDCAGDIAMSIDTLGDLIKAIHYVQTLPAGDKTHDKAEDALNNSALSASRLSTYGFRNTVEGVPYNTGAATYKDTLISDLKDAYDEIALANGGSLTDADVDALTWADIQKAIIESKGGTVPVGTTFWWNPDSYNPPTISTWEDLWKYSIQATLGVDGDPSKIVPDAFDSFDQDALDDLVSEKPGTSTATNVGWFRTGVVTGDEAEKFTLADFFTPATDSTPASGAWLDALKVLTAPSGSYTAADVDTASWEEIQWALIHPSGPYKSYIDIMNDTSVDYWWKAGGNPKLTFDKLLDALNDYYFESDSKKLDALLANGVDPINNQVYIRKDITGSEFESVMDFKSAVMDAFIELEFSTTNGAADYIVNDAEFDSTKLDEYVLQYILIHYQDFASGTITSIPDSATIATDPNEDYWWFDGGAPSGAMPIRNIKELFNAYFWYTGTSTGVSGQNASALDNLDAATLESLGFRQDDWGVPFNASETNANLVSILTAAMDKMPYKATNISSVSAEDLAKELQNVLITGTYVPASAVTEDFWWQTTGEYPVPTSQQEVLEAAWKAFVGNDDGDTVPEAEDALKALSLDFINKRTTGLAMRGDEEGAEFRDANTFINKLQTALTTIQNGGLGYSGLSGVTQRQLQHFILGNPYDTNANIESATIDTTDPANPVDAYWWFENDTKPSTVTKKEKPIDPAKWSFFINALNDYIMWGIDPNGDGNDNAFSLGQITVDMINDELYLRKADGSKFASWSEVYDGQWDEILTMAYSAISSDGACYGDGSDPRHIWDENDGATLLREPTWYELQYAIMHTDYILNNGDMASKEDCEKEAKEKYDWRYEEDTEEPPTLVPIPIDPAKWTLFVNALNDYIMWGIDPNGDGNDNAFSDGTITLFMINDELLLRKADGSKFASWSEVYDGQWDEILTMAFSAISSDGACYGDGSNPRHIWDENDGATLLREPTWYEIQYAIMHTDYILNNGDMADSDTCEAEAREKYDWRFAESSSSGEEQPVEIQVDPAKWSLFINALNDYIMWGIDPNGDGGDNAFSAGTITLDMINNDLLLRKADGSKFASWSEVYDGQWDEILTMAFSAISSDGACYGDGSDSRHIWDENDGATLLREPTWYEMQYAIMHTDYILNNGDMADNDTCKAEAKNYPWKWKTASGEAPKVPVEIPIDSAKWSLLITSLNNYIMWGNAPSVDGVDNGFSNSLITLDMINNDLLLRKADGSKFADWSEVYTENWDEILTMAYSAISADGANYGDGSDPRHIWDENDGATLLREPTWYELQYAIMHTDYILNNGDMADNATCQAAAKDYAWKWTTE